MSQMNPKEFGDNTAYSVQLPYIADVCPFKPKSLRVPLLIWNSTLIKKGNSKLLLPDL